MLSSLGVGVRRYGGPQHAPQSSASSFLTLGTSAVGVASTSPRPLMDMGAGVAFVSEARPRRAPAGPARFNISHIAEGTFTEKTVENMHRAVLAAKTDARWRQMMEDIRRRGREVGAIGWKDWLGELAWFDRWYRDDHFIDYVRDPHQVEMVKHPMLVYWSRAGDCDDSSATLAASLGALGAPHKFRTYRADPRRPNEWTHVVAQIHIPGHGWVNDDLTVRNANVGFEPAGFQYKDWHEPRWD